MAPEIYKWFNKKFPQNYIIKNPFTGTLVIALFVFGFTVLYKPLNTHAAGALSYTGTEIKGANFYSHSEGNLRLSVVPVWLKFTYQFNSGKAVSKISRTKEEIDNMPKKGF